jgi:hypothetical protein
LAAPWHRPKLTLSCYSSCLRSPPFAYWIDRTLLFRNTAIAGQRTRSAVTANPRSGTLCAMFSKLLGHVKKQQKLHSWKGSALGRAIDEHIKTYTKNWKHLEKEEKERFVSEFKERIFALLDSPQSAIQCRRELVTNVVAYTDLQVLCLTAQDKENNPIFKDMERISSELQTHLYTCTLRNNELNKYVEENGYEESELNNFVTRKCEIYRFYAYGLDIVRRNIETANERDWFVPLVQSSMIISESNYRKYLGLPAIVTAIDSSFHSRFIDMALNGELDPLLAWERRFGKSHSATI